MNENLKATITIKNKVRHKVNPMIYGHFIEEMGDCIHDGIWAYSRRYKKYTSR